MGEDPNLTLCTGAAARAKVPKQQDVLRIRIPTQNNRSRFFLVQPLLKARGTLPSPTGSNHRSLLK
jgi:hypothetical protein